MAGETILIIDDNADVRVLLGERVLPSYGYRTLTAPDGQEGLWQIRTHNPDLILLDLRLPDMTGLDLLHILSSEGYDTPVILITAYGSELIAAQALRLGVHDYIIKPFTLDEIVESVERALTEQRLRRERNALAERVQFHTTALRLLVDIGNVVAQKDLYLQLCRLLEMTITATRSNAGRLWVRESQEEGLHLRVAQDRGDQQAYLLHRREEPSPQVKEALRSGVHQQWSEESTGTRETALAIPVLLAGQPSAVLEIYLPDEEILQDDAHLLVLRGFAERAGMLLECFHLRQQATIHQRQAEALGILSQDMILALDEEDTIIAATPAAQAMLGQPPEEIIGQSFRQWIQGIESPQGELVDWYMQQADADQASELYAFTFQDPEGKSRQAEVQVLAQQEEGTLHRYLLFHEVTAYNRLEQEVRYLRRALGEAARGSGLGLSLTDLKGTVLAVNGVLSDLLQCSQEELLGQPLWEAFATAEAGHLLAEQIARAHREGSSYIEIGWPEKEIGTLGITALLLLGAEGAPYGIVVLVGPIQPSVT